MLRRIVPVLISLTTTMSYAQNGTSAWTVYDDANSPLPGNRVTAIEIDRDGVAWIGTSGGLANLRGSMWTVWDVGAMVGTGGDSWIEAIALDSTGGAWVITSTTAMHYSKGAWTIHSALRASLGFPTKAIRDVAVAPDGGVWLASDSVYRFDGATWRNLGGIDAWHIAVNPEGEVEAACTYGLFRFDGERMRMFSLPGMHMHASPVDFARDKQNRQWYLFGSSMVRRDGDTTYTIVNRNFVTSSMETNSSVAFADDGSWWLGAYHGYDPRWSSSTGLAHVEGDSWTIYTSATSGLPNDNVRSVRVAADGRVWVGTTLAGLAILNPRALTSVDDDASPSRRTNIQPNPAENFTTIRMQMPKSEHVSAVLVDALGRHRAELDFGLLGSGVKSLSIDVRDFESGGYFVRLRVGHSAVSLPLWIVK